jgi:Protein phosphatase 2C
MAGGRIARWRRNIGPLRVWLPRDWTPGLAMTRSIGDTVLSEYGVSPVPEVTYTRLTPSDSFAVLASDGVWEFMTSQDVVDFVGRFRRESKSAAVAAEALVREAVRRWRRNEVVVDDLQESPPPARLVLEQMAAFRVLLVSLLHRELPSNDSCAVQSP